MKTSPLTWRELLPHLPASLGQGEVERRLTAEAEQDEQPRILNFFAGVGAWFSALFMLPFFYMSDVFDHASSCAVLGLILFAGAVVMSRRSTHVFLSQLALSALLSGNSLVLLGVYLSGSPNDGREALPMLVQAVLAAVTCGLFQGVTGRFITLIGVPVLAVVWVFSGDSLHGLHAITAGLALATGLLYRWEKRPVIWDVVAWASVVSLPGIILLTEMLHGNAWHERQPTPLWPSSLIAGLLLIWMVTEDAGGAKAMRRRWWWGLVLATLFLAGFTTPGITVAMVLLFLGRAQDERVLTVIGHAFFAAFLVLFYYALNISLAQKSWIIAGSGAFLLAMRFWLGRSLRKEAA